MSFLTLAFCSSVPPAEFPVCRMWPPCLLLAILLARLTSTNSQSLGTAICVLSFSSPPQTVRSICSLVPIFLLPDPTSCWPKSLSVVARGSGLSDRWALLDVSPRVPFAGECGASLQASLRTWSEDGDQTARRWCVRGEGCSADEEVWTEHFSHLGCACLWDAGRDAKAAGAAHSFLQPR